MHLTFNMGFHFSRNILVNHYWLGKFSINYDLMQSIYFFPLKTYFILLYLSI